LNAGVNKLFESNQVREGPIRSLTDLEKMPNLKQISISMQNITDISPLASLQNLESVEIKNNPVTDISFLSGMKFLRRVSIFDTRVTDFSPLLNCPMLVELDVGKLPIRSLEAFN
jgi:internalin A